MIALTLGGANLAFAFSRQDDQAIIAWAFLTVCGLIAGVVWLSKRRQVDRSLSKSDQNVSGIQISVSFPDRPVRQTPQRSQGHQARWVKANQTYELGNIRLPFGFFYAGEWLPVADGASTQYAINPRLPSDSRQADVSGASMPYWPSYAAIAPAARRAFLEWLASPRNDPSYGIGHVFIYFYGLEHRFFLDPEADDRLMVVKEVQRLLDIYRDNDSFRRYAGRFLTVAWLMGGKIVDPPALTAEDLSGTQFDLDLHLHLGRELRERGALSADDALRWIVSTGAVSLRTPAVRCFEEFLSLWRMRFAQQYPGELMLTGKGTIKLAYTASSRAFEVPIAGEHESYPDIQQISAPSTLTRLAEDCMDALDSYSRAVGRRPHIRSSIASATLLPEELQSGAFSLALDNFRCGISAVMGERGHAATSAAILLDIAGLEPGEDGKISGQTADELGRALDRLDLAIEPDRRYGTGVPRADEQVYLFRAERGGPIDPQRAPFLAMRRQVEVCMLAVAVDGEVTIDELGAVFTRIKSEARLSSIERARLCAFAADAYRNPPKLAGIRKAVVEAPLSEREAYAQAAIATLGAGAAVDVAEIAFLTKLYRLLGLPKERVFKDIHREAATAPGAKPIAAPAPTPTPAVSKPRVSIGGRDIDIDELERKRGERGRTTDFIGTVLPDEADMPPLTPPTRANDTGSLAGLPRPYAELVEMLFADGGTPRAEFDRRARERRLLPQEALDRINEWALDTFGDELLSEGEPLAIAPDMVGRIAELRQEAAE